MFIHTLRHLSLVLIGLLLVACGADSDGSDGAATSGEAEAPESASTADRGEAQPSEPQRDVISDRLPYAEVDDELVYGYFVFPSDMVEPLPAVIMIHEWFGLNDTIRKTANRLAAEGYIVLAVDLFAGQTAETAADARKLMVNVVENPDPAFENIRQAFDFVSTTAGAPQVASIGWSFGGGWSLNTALLFPDRLDAAVIYYGQIIDDDEQLGTINAPILGLFGGADRGIKPESVESFKAALDRLRKSYDIHVYDGAKHNFANPASNNYDATMADDAWRRTLDFLSQNLSGDGV